jgi:hypothetical protein
MVSSEMRITKGHGNRFVSHKSLHHRQVHTCPYQATAKVCCKSCNVKSAIPAFATARSNAVRKFLYGVPYGVQNTGLSSACAVILPTFNAESNTSFIGTPRLSPFLAYAARTVMARRQKSTSA